MNKPGWLAAAAALSAAMLLADGASAQSPPVGGAGKANIVFILMKR